MEGKNRSLGDKWRKKESWRNCGRKKINQVGGKIVREGKKKSRPIRGKIYGSGGKEGEKGGIKRKKREFEKAIKRRKRSKKSREGIERTEGRGYGRKEKKG